MSHRKKTSLPDLSWRQAGQCVFASPVLSSSVERLRATTTPDTVHNLVLPATADPVQPRSNSSWSCGDQSVVKILDRLEMLHPSLSFFVTSLKIVERWERTKNEAVHEIKNAMFDPQTKEELIAQEKKTAERTKRAGDGCA
jgi:hypothetical protein